MPSRGNVRVVSVGQIAVVVAQELLDGKAGDGKEKKPQPEEEGSRNRVYRLLRRCAFVVEFAVPKKSAQGDVVSLTQAYFREAPYEKECGRRSST